MKAISLWQPHATWIAMKWKTVETRTHARFAKLEGQRIAIHASKKMDPDFGAFPFWKTPHSAVDIMNMAMWIPRCMGHIVCTAQVVDAKWAPNVDFVERDDWDHSACCLVEDKFCLFFDDIKPLSRPVPFRGR